MTINSLLSEETIANKIYFIRNQKVMLDRDLAILYGIDVIECIKKRQSHSGKYSNYAHFYQSTTNAFGHHRIKNRHPPDSEKIRKSRQKY